jgi:hypothetical protein
MAFLRHEKALVKRGRCCNRLQQRPDPCSKRKALRISQIGCNISGRAGQRTADGFDRKFEWLLNRYGFRYRDRYAITVLIAST